MRFHRLALPTVALVAINAFSTPLEFALAEEVDTTVPAEVPDGETHKFQAEVNRVLDIVVNSLYQNKDVFLRELISNASDALDKIRFLAIQKPELLSDKPELEVRIQYDAEERTLTITDSGIGMTKDDLVSNLGTVARSGTGKFMDALSDGAADISQIGMFGVGFYSSFLVADGVTVASKHPTSDHQYIWKSTNGDDSYFIGEDPRGNVLGRGTEITLHLKDDAEEYAEFNKLSELVGHYSEFITHPIFVRKTEIVEVPDEDDIDADESEDLDDTTEGVTDADDEEDSDEDEEKEDEPPKMKELTTHSWVKSNADAAIWNRNKDEISDDEYQQFYKVVAKDHYGNATSWSHFDAEGSINFKSLVYMPSTIPPSLRNPDPSNDKSSLKLYVRKVLISDDFELLPPYLSFVTGVVDSDDLPLNVNRETLQESKIITIIRKKVTRKVLDMISKFSKSEIAIDEEGGEAEVEIDEEGNVISPEETEEEEKEHPYIEWYENFQPSIKRGIVEDDANRNRLAKLVRIKTNKSDGKFITFEDYVENMKEWQKQIYFISGQSTGELEKSPFMEKFEEKDLEVIFFTEPADEYVVSHLREFSGKKFTTITHENIEFDDEDKDLQTRRNKAYQETYRPLIKFMHKFYGNAVTKAKISVRLGSAPAIVSSSEYGHSANMQRIMEAQAFTLGKDVMQGGLKTLEINPRHPFVASLLDKIPDEDDEDAKPSIEVRDALWTLLDTALLNGGYKLSEGKAFSMRMMRSIKRDLGVESVELLDEIDPPVEDDVPPEIDGLDGINMEDFDMADLDMDEFE